jgi:peptide/nickel transport system substrate-binding protein
MTSPLWHPERRRTAAVIAVCAALSTSLVACGSSSEPTTSTTTITTAWPSDLTSLDPANLSTGQDRMLVRNIYQTLLSPKFAEQKDGSLLFQGAEVVPYLAESWDEGDASITFHLRKGVMFHGTDHEVTADDVEFSLRRIWNSPGVGDLQANGLQRPDQIKVVDPHTVTIAFETPDGEPTPVTPTLLAIFGQAFTSIVDKDAVEPHITEDDPDGGKWLRANAVGSGPYFIERRNPGQSITLEASDDSWMPEPAYPTVNIQITSASTSSLLTSGAINLGESGFTNAQVNSLDKAGMNVVWQETGFFDMFAITSGPPEQVGALADPRVRQAIAYALPYDDVLDKIIFGRGARAESIVSPTAPEYTPAWGRYETDLAKAQALMDQAGNPTIDVPLYHLQGNEDQTNTAILIQANLKKIGIRTKLTPVTDAGLFDVVNARSQTAKGAEIGPPGLELFNWTPWTDDPKIVVGYWATTGGINNYPLWSNLDVDKANATYALQPTSSERTAAYQKAQETIADEAPLIPIVTTGTVAVTAPGIAGVSFAPTGSGRYWTLHPEDTESEIASLLD